MKWLTISWALLLLSAPLPDSFSIRYKEQIVENVKRADYELLPALPIVDPEKFERLLERLHERVYERPQNATIGESGQIVPEKVGYRLDRNRFAEKFYDSLFGSGSPSIEVPRTAVYPRVDSELLAPLREKPIGHYVTYFNSRNKNRSHNIGLASKAINNTVVFPGETFSFNRAVGIRTISRGYLPAPIIVRGELSEGIGGGICQVSSTLFNAIDRAGLTIVKRYSHSRNVPYVPPGRDATVSWGGPDFVFLNPYNQPVLIRTFTGGGRVFVTVYSSDEIEYSPREVPGISERLPEEIKQEKPAGNRKIASH
ncbi:VanW family protein [Cohnella massiliensis]|uniref:VanW family protein n=1 Tax=Cohnella massiliensis TaxID=1816691 RepID=UPI0009BC6E14|nr:VanW family protein [Cohnella massiliensis]